MAERERTITASAHIRVTVKTPAAIQPVSRGFYQVEEDVLYIPLFPGGKFYSFLDSDDVVFDIDQTGRLLFIQVRVPRHKWHIRKALRLPAAYTTADIRFLNFRDTLPPVVIETNPHESLLRLTFSDEKANAAYAIADNLLVETTASETLKTIWILAIENDRAARTMAAWRKQARRDMKQYLDDSEIVRIEIRR